MEFEIDLNRLEEEEIKSLFEIVDKSRINTAGIKKGDKIEYTKHTHLDIPPKDKFNPFLDEPNGVQVYDWDKIKQEVDKLKPIKATKALRKLGMQTKGSTYRKMREILNLPKNKVGRKAEHNWEKVEKKIVKMTKKKPMDMATIGKIVNINPVGAHYYKLKEILEKNKIKKVGKMYERR